MVKDSIDKNTWHGHMLCPVECPVSNLEPISRHVEKIRKCLSVRMEPEAGGLVRDEGLDDGAGLARGAEQGVLE